MTYVDNAAAMWIASSGAIPTALPFELVLPSEGWFVIVLFLAAVCAALSIVTNPQGVLGRRRTLRIVHDRARRPRQPQRA